MLEQRHALQRKDRGTPSPPAPSPITTFHHQRTTTQQITGAYPATSISGLSGRGDRAHDHQHNQTVSALFTELGAQGASGGRASTAVAHNTPYHAILIGSAGRKGDTSERAIPQLLYASASPPHGGNASKTRPFSPRQLIITRRPPRARKRTLLSVISAALPRFRYYLNALATTTTTALYSTARHRCASPGSATSVQNHPRPEHSVVASPLTGTTLTSRGSNVPLTHHHAPATRAATCILQHNATRHGQDPR